MTALRQKPKDQEEGSYGLDCSKLSTTHSQRTLESKLPYCTHTFPTILASLLVRKKAGCTYFMEKKKKARFSFHISDCLQTRICETFHSKINCVLKKVWNSRAFMLPSFEMASECRSLLSFLEYFLTINRINDHRARSLPNPSGPKCEKRRRREGTF